MFWVGEHVGRRLKSHISREKKQSAEIAVRYFFSNIKSIVSSLMRILLHVNVYLLAGTIYIYNINQFLPYVVFHAPV